jgi:hypothetical protein
LRSILERRYPKATDPNEKVTLDFDYEPIEALYLLLEQGRPEHTAIGGAPQLVKAYCYGNSLPFVVRTRGGYYLLGRRLFDWEKTQYPVIDLTYQPARVHYPMKSIPVTADLDRYFVEAALEGEVEDALDV